MSESTTPAPQTELRRELSLFDSVMINIGSMIGSGIFLVPATIALSLHGSMTFLGVWVIGGVVSLCGALAIGELGGMMPRAGGQYVYLKEAYGPLWGFLYGWAAFAVINTASIAAVAVAFAAYLSYFIPMGQTGLNIVAVGSIIVLTVVNCFGIRIGALIQDGFTVIKIGVIALLIFAAIVLPGGSSEHFVPLWTNDGFAAIGVALVAVLGSYDGWIEITYVAGEVKNPGRTLPRSLIIATLVVMALYIGINAACLYVLPADRIIHSDFVASDTAAMIAGRTGAVIVSLAVLCSTFGANNGFIFTSPRIYYAMAKDGLFFRSFGRLHPKYSTPVLSLVIQGFIASVMALTGSFNDLFTYMVFASWLFYALSAGAVLVLRRKSPDAERPYRTWGYPWTLFVFLAFALWFMGNALLETPKDTLIGLGLVLAGLPVYFYWRRSHVSVT